MMSHRVFKYDLGMILENDSGVREQIAIAREYRRALIRTERNRRMLRLAVLEWVPEFCSAREASQKARERVSDAVRQASQERAETGKRELSGGVQALLDEARAADRKATDLFMASLKAALKQGELTRAFESIDAGVNEEQKRLRQEFGQKGLGLYWGTSDLVRQSVDASIKSVPEFGRIVNGTCIPGPEHCSPKDAESDADVSLGVQLQGGLGIKHLFGGDTQIEILDTKALQPQTRSERVMAHRARNAQRRQDARLFSEAERSVRRQKARDWALRVRVGSTGPGNLIPIWASWPIVLHRPIPDDATVMNASVTLRHVGPYEQWSCQITVKTEEHFLGREHGSGVVGVDIGWRKTGDALRVCALWGNDGGPGMDLRLSKDIISALRKCEELRSVRDKKRDVFLPRFHNVLSKIEQVPDWLRSRTKTLQRWESCNRIHNLLTEWKERGRFQGDKRAFTMLSGYCYRDEHLWAWEDCQRKKALRRRREGYRVIAAALARTYDTLVVEDFDLRKMAKRKPVGQDIEADNETARSNRVVACTSELRDCLIKAFVSHGGRAVSVSAVNTTRECHITRIVEVFDAAAAIRHGTSMGTDWDQDDNAARNLVQRYLERSGDAKNLGGARVDKKTGKVVEMAGGKYRRNKSAKACSVAEKGTARKPLDNAAE